MILQQSVPDVPARQILPLSEGVDSIFPISLVGFLSCDSAATVQVSLIIFDQQSGLQIWESTGTFSSPVGGSTFRLSAAPNLATKLPSGAAGDGMILPIPEMIGPGDRIEVQVAVSAGSALMSGFNLRYESG